MKLLTGKYGWKNHLRKYPSKKSRLKLTTWCKQKCKEPQLNIHSRHAHKWRFSSRKIHKWRSQVRWFVYMRCCRKHWASLPVCCLHHIISWIMLICFCFSIVLRRILDLFLMHFGWFFGAKILFWWKFGASLLHVCMKLSMG